LESTTKGDEHSEEWLEIFISKSEQEMTAKLEFAIEEEEDNIDFSNLCEELEALEKKVNMQSQHIQ
jgi:hypothetical protein